MKLGDHFVEWGDVIVPLDNGRNGTKPAKRCAVQVPDLIANHRVVRIDDVGHVVLVTGKMKLHHAVGWDPFNECQRIVVVIEGAHKNIIHVKHEPAARLLHHLRQEFPFGHFGAAELHIGRYVFEGDGTFEIILNVLDARNDVRQGFARIGNWKEVVKVDAVNPRPAEMVGNECRLDPVCQRFQIAQIVIIERRRRCNRKRDAVKDDGEARADAVEHHERLPAWYHIVFRDRFKPIDGRVALENVAVMLGTQT